MEHCHWISSVAPTAVAIAPPHFMQSGCYAPGLGRVAATITQPRSSASLRPGPRCGPMAPLASRKCVASVMYTMAVPQGVRRLWMERESYAAESGCPRAVAPVCDAKAYKPRPCSLTSSSRTWLAGERDDASRSLPLFPACPRRVAHTSRPVGRPRILLRQGTRARLLT